LITAVEQKQVAGATGIRGHTRMVIVGDTYLFGNYLIDGGANRDFLGYAVNWLANRATLLQNIGPHPVTEYRLNLSVAQKREVNWILLAGLPGAILVLGGLVSFVRRK
jgi:ABC-type uncharacterized transport system involved in gliding motility auxiliary subunit